MLGVEGRNCEQGLNHHVLSEAMAAVAYTHAKNAVSCSGSHSSPKGVMPLSSGSLITFVEMVRGVIGNPTVVRGFPWAILMPSVFLC
ncbi:hypothetical protein Nepgr_027281 [Nepenthes gracilis]|uniref:Uncharacterized protein n=1 Tax=Nepenthes gracilis TaxID=150966 RepID=A0AAD3Y1B8_NEPGR|nr:hypothetical protein Nepgr_027281 [Nepenthes gracilis]